MDYLHKLRGAMSTAVDTVNKTMPGNPVWREYEVGQQVASAGPALSWKIYAGRKKSTKKEVAVWVFERRDIERWPKIEKDMFADLLKQGVARLTRIRHPRVLTVEQPLEESRDCLAFCTEPIFASVANVLGRVDNMAVVPSHLESFKLEDVEIRHGIFQLCESLAFLHNDARMLHRNLCPESVIINAKGSWKLAGVDFLVQVPPPTSTTEHPSYPQLEWDANLMPCTQPVLNFVAPEHFVSGRCDTSADIYSLGCLAYAVFNKGNAPFDHGNNLGTFRKNAEKLKSLPNKLLENIPADFREDLKMCLNFTPDLRPDATQLSKETYFDNILVKTLCYFDALCQMDNVQKSQFFKGLPTVLVQFPKRPLLQKVLPALAAEFSSVDMIPFMLPSVFHIAEQSDEVEYVQHVLPHLVPVFQMQQPYQIPLMLLQKMELLLSKTPDDDVRQHLLPLMYNALSSDSGQIQELCLGIIPSVCKLVDRDSMKSTLLPILLRLATEGTLLSVKVNALLCIGKLLDKLEKWMVTEQILPTLPKINSKEPGVLMAVLGIYKLAFQHPKIGIAKEQCAKSALPFLISQSIDASLNVAQFDAFMTLIRAMLERVETEQRQRLQQLGAMTDDQRTKNFNDVIAESTARRAVSPDLKDLAGFGASSSGNTSLATNGRARGPMTFEEKKRLAAEQESTLKLRQQTPLNPAEKKKQPMSSMLQPEPSNRSNTASPSSLAAFDSLVSKPIIKAPPTTSAPKDLTSSLAGLQFGSPVPPALRPPPGNSGGSAFGISGSGGVGSSMNSAFGGSNGTTTNAGIGASSTSGWTPINMSSTSTVNWQQPAFGAMPSSTMSSNNNHYANNNTSGAFGDLNSFGPMSSANSPRSNTTTSTMAPNRSNNNNVNMAAFDSLVAFPAQQSQKTGMAQMGNNNMGNMGINNMGNMGNSSMGNMGNSSMFGDSSGATPMNAMKNQQLQQPKKNTLNSIDDFLS